MKNYKGKGEWIKIRNRQGKYNIKLLLIITSIILPVHLGVANELEPEDIKEEITEQINEKEQENGDNTGKGKEEVGEEVAKGDPSIKQIRVLNRGVYTPKTKYISGHNTHNYDDGEYRGVLERYLHSGSAADTKYVTGQPSKLYNSEGYKGTLTQYVYSGSYTPEDTKFVTGHTTGTYNKDGYTGTLDRYLHDGSYTPAHTKSVTGQSSANYNVDGYVGTLSRYLASGSYTPADTKFVSGQTSGYYNSGGYTGTLSSYVYSGSYTPSDTKYVSGQTSSNYNSGGYSGTLDKYVYSGSYTPSASKTVTDTRDGYSTSAFTCVKSSYGTNSYMWTLTSTGSSSNVPQSLSYNSGGYTGTLKRYKTDKVGDNGGKSGSCSSPGQVHNRRQTYVAYFSGTVTKPASDTRVYRYRGDVTRPSSDTRVYRYEGYVTRPESDTRVYKYRGDVTKPAVDTRVYRYQGDVTKPATDTRVYKYQGYVSKPDTREYLYRGTVYEIDKEAPIITINILPSDNPYLTYKARVTVEDEYSGVDMSQYQFTESPEIPEDNNWTEFESGDVLTTSRLGGKRTYYLHILARDKEGNVSTKSEQITTLDITAPKIELSLGITGWTNKNQSIIAKVSDRESGIDRILRGEGGLVRNVGGLKEITEEITGYTSNGRYSVVAYDLAGNRTEEAINISNIDKEKPTLDLDYAPKNWTGEVEITATGKDNLSGVKDIRLTSPLGNKNLLSLEDIRGRNLEEFEKLENGVRIVSKGEKESGIKIPSDILEPNTDYTLSFYVKKESGDVETLGGDIDSSDDVEVIIGGKKVKGDKEEPASKNQEGSTNYVNYSNDTSKQHVTVKLNTNKYEEVEDKSIYIQPNQHVAYMGGENTYEVVLENIQLEKGTEESSYEPNFKDINLLSGVNPYKVSVTENGEYSFKVTDNAGNEYTDSIGISNIDKIAPTMKITKGSDGWVIGSEELTIELTDKESGLSTLYLPNGTTEDLGSKQTYTTTFKATGNKEYTFKVEDNAGNITEQTVSVTNIDDIKPSMKIDYTPKGWTREGVEITVTGKDDESGVKDVRLTAFNGNNVTDETPNLLPGANPYKILATKNGNYSFTVTDKAGNKYTETINITNVDKTAPEITDNVNLITGDEIKSNGYVLTERAEDKKLASDNSLKAGDIIEGQSGQDWVDFVEVESGAPYMFVADDGLMGEPRVAFYDADKKYIGSHYIPTNHRTNDNVYVRENKTIWVEDALFRTPKGTNYVRLSSANGTSTSEENKGQRGNKWGLYKVEEFKLVLEVTDKQSGVKSITLPDNTKVSGGVASYPMTENEVVTVGAEDNVENKSTREIKVDKLLIPYGFMLIGKDNKPLEGAGFDLYRNGEKYAYGESGKDGVANFGNVPPTGKYTYKQVKAPEGHIIDTEEKDVDDITEPEEFVSFPRGDELPSTGLLNISIALIVGLTVLIIGNEVYNKVHKEEKEQ